LKLNGTHQLLVYNNDVNILGGNVHNLKEDTKCLIVLSKEIGLELMVTNQSAGHVSISEL
jgi:hypothetical protein